MDEVVPADVKKLALERLMLVLHCRSIDHKRNRNFDAAYSCLSRVIELAAENPERQAMAYVDRGALFVEFGRADWTRSLPDFEAVLNAPMSPMSKSS